MSGSYYNRLIVKVVAIINPISGAGADPHVAGSRMALLHSELQQRAIAADMQLTGGPGHANEIARRAVSDGADLVIVWGGDGTVNETGAALMGTGCALGLVPSGSGNGLAAALGTPFEPRAAIAAALEGAVRRIDAGMFGGRPFFNIAGIGVDARIAALFNLRARGARGRWPYVLLGIREGCRYGGVECAVDLDDGRPRQVPVLLVAFANGPQYGNGVTLAPRARLDDGLLDALVVEDRPVLARFWHARHLVRGTADTAPRVSARQVRRATVVPAGPVDYHVDGESGTIDGAIDVSVQPGALLVRGAWNGTASTARGDTR